MRQEQAQIVRQISGLGEISDRYDAILCDIWGVLHNGLASFAPASAAFCAAILIMEWLMSRPVME